MWKLISEAYLLWKFRGYRADAEFMFIDDSSSFINLLGKNFQISRYQLTALWPRACRVFSTRLPYGVVRVFLLL